MVFGVVSCLIIAVGQLKIPSHGFFFSVTFWSLNQEIVQLFTDSPARWKFWSWLLNKSGGHLHGGDGFFVHLAQHFLLWGQLFSSLVGRFRRSLSHHLLPESKPGDARGWTSSRFVKVVRLLLSLEMLVLNFGPLHEESQIVEQLLYTQNYRTSMFHSKEQ